jgi:hypothetical protein
MEQKSRPMIIPIPGRLPPKLSLKKTTDPVPGELPDVLSARCLSKEIADILLANHS